MEELELVCAEHGGSLGVYAPRSEVIRRGLWCRSTNVFVVNAAGYILCHQRSLEKERLPGYWSTHLGGHVSRHETYETNALKELEEEAGLRISASQLIPWRTTSMSHARLWVREYVVFADLPVEAFTPQPGEVECFAWLSPEEILRQVAAGERKWCAGTLDFSVERHCLEAVLTAAKAFGVVGM